MREEEEKEEDEEQGHLGSWMRTTTIFQPTHCISAPTFCCLCQFDVLGRGIQGIHSFSCSVHKLGTAPTGTPITRDGFHWGENKR